MSGAAGHFGQAAEKDTAGRAVSDDLFAGLLSAQAGDRDAAILYLESVVSSDQPLPDDLMAKYVPGAALEVGVTDGP